MRLTILISVLFLTSFDLKTKYIDPTGTYRLGCKTVRRIKEKPGYSGKIQVKKISSEKIIMTFEVTKGSPSYNSGSFIDTLNYNNNKSIYSTPEFDSTCLITFEFNKKGVIVKEETEDYNYGCGFGHAVVASGFYKRISNKAPILTEPLTDTELEK